MIVVSTCFELTHAQEPSHTAIASAGDVGEAEILFRSRRNELETIQVCRDSVAFIVVVRLFGPLLPPANTEIWTGSFIKRIWAQEPPPLRRPYPNMTRTQRGRKYRRVPISPCALVSQL